MQSQKVIRVFDCSNSEDSDSSSRCLTDNDVVSGLKKYASYHDVQFIVYPKDADVIFTNDIYPPYIFDECPSTPRVKRMGGFYWQNHLKQMNIPLNEAAVLSDYVVFVSDFSLMSFFNLYGTVDDIGCRYTVIPNNVDDHIFYPKNPPLNKMFQFIAAASDWAKEEERFGDLLDFMMKMPHCHFKIIGKCDYEVPENAQKLGCIEDDRVKADILRGANAFVNVSYKEAAPKAVCQAINCGLPVLYGDSGGVSEFVPEGMGIGVKDNIDISFDEHVMHLDVNEMVDKWQRYTFRYSSKSAWGDSKLIPSYFSTMARYSDIFRLVIDNRKHLDKLILSNGE